MSCSKKRLSAVGARHTNLLHHKLSIKVRDARAIGPTSQPDARFFGKHEKTDEKPAVCLLAENEERFWNDHVEWKSEERVEHDGIVWLNRDGRVLH